MSEKEKVQHRKKKDVSLLGIFGMETLKDLLKTMAAATDFSFSVIDYKGKTLIDSMIRNEYCLKYMNKPEVCGECQISAAFAAAKAAIKCGPYIFRCPQGFVRIAVPVIVNDQYLGAIVGGRIRCEDELLDEKGSAVISDYKRNEEEEKLFCSVQELPRKKILAVADLMFLLLKEMGEKETLEFQLDKQIRTEKHLRDIRRKNELLKKELEKQQNRSMKAKILPHFLLDLFVAVSNFAILENATKTEEFMADIASVLRYYIDEAADFISMNIELIQMENYLKVLKRQYGERINYKISYPDSVKKQMIPSLSLFPFLTYVIICGVLPGYFQGTVCLDVKEDGDRNFVTIRLDDEDVSVHRRIISRNDVEIPDRELLLEQIENTKRRLQFAYGEDCKITLQPDLVVIDIPKLKVNQE